MARLIDAGKCPCKSCLLESECFPGLCDNFARWLESSAEVVHGEWFVVEDDYFDLVELQCSVCGESWGFEDYEDCIPKNYHYCPNCGAKMDKERKDNG